MTPDQIRLAHRRLQLGITNVGIWVLTASAGLYWLADHDAHAVDAWRLAVIAADRAAADAEIDPRGWITRFPGLVGEDGSPRAAVETIFTRFRRRRGGCASWRNHRRVSCPAISRAATSTTRGQG